MNTPTMTHFMIFQIIVIVGIVLKMFISSMEQVLFVVGILLVLNLISELLDNYYQNKYREQYDKAPKEEAKKEVSKKEDEDKGAGVVSKRTMIHPTPGWYPIEKRTTAITPVQNVTPIDLGKLGLASPMKKETYLQPKLLHDRYMQVLDEQKQMMGLTRSTRPITPNY